MFIIIVYPNQSLTSIILIRDKYKLLVVYPKGQVDD